MKIKGRVWIFEDNDINTDLIFPGKSTYEPLQPEEMVKYAMEDYDAEFTILVKEYDIIVTGKNFGCGSSREQAVTCLKYAGVGAIIAKSFARLFYRNAVNSALAVIECPEVVDAVSQEAKEKESRLSNLTMQINLSEGNIFFASQKFSFPPLDEQARQIFKAAGLVEYTKRRLQNS